MAMGRRRPEKQETLFVATDCLPKSAGHPFYDRLNQVLAEAGFDAWIENRCQSDYAADNSAGHPSIPPGVYFRMLFVGYFEGIDSQRGIAWRCADSLGLRRFLGLSLAESSPDRSTLTLTRKRLPAKVFEEVFQIVLSIAALNGMLAGKTVGVDSTTLEANAAMKSIVRKDTGEDWRAYVVRLMREEGVIEPNEEPTDEEVRRFDKGRKNKRVSNDEWQSRTDPASRIATMKDGRTHLAYKAEHVVDLENQLVLAAEIYPANRGDTDTLIDSVMQAQLNVDAANERAGLGEEQIEEVAADKGYDAAAAIKLADTLHLRNYIPEPKRKHRPRWTNKPEEFGTAVLNNRRRTRRDKSRKLQRLRSERAERSFAHVCETGGARRTWLRGLMDVTKRYLITVAGHNLGRVLRKLFGIGKPRALQGGSSLPRLCSVPSCGCYAQRNAPHSGSSPRRSQRPPDIWDPCKTRITQRAAKRVAWSFHPATMPRIRVSFGCRARAQLLSQSEGDQKAPLMAPAG
jgi:IS5 family transposase